MASSIVSPSAVAEQVGIDRSSGRGSSQGDVEIGGLWRDVSDLVDVTNDGLGVPTHDRTGQGSVTEPQHVVERCLDEGSQQSFRLLDTGLRSRSALDASRVTRWFDAWARAAW